MKQLRDLSIGFIGAGVVGTTLAVAFDRQGMHVNYVYSRSLKSASNLADRLSNCKVADNYQDLSNGCDLVFVTTPDSSISIIASNVKWQNNQIVIHCSGVQSLEALTIPESYGALIGCFHPLQTFIELNQGIDALYGTAFAIEGNEEVLSFLEDLALTLGGFGIKLAPEDKALYHASAVLVSGSLVSLLSIASQLWQKMGYKSEKAVECLLPLMRTTVSNVANKGMSGALTGPYSRGDIETIEKHLDAISDKRPEFLELYCLLGLAQVPLAINKGTIAKEDGARIESLIGKFADGVA